MPEEIRVILLHAQGLILPELPKSLAEFAQRLLAKRGVELRLPAPRAARPSRCLGRGRLREGRGREERRAVPADRPARNPRSQVRRPEHRGGDSGWLETSVLVHRPRQDGLARPPLGSRGDLRTEALWIPRLVALADDLPDEAPRARPQGPRRDRLDPRPDPAPRHHPAQDRAPRGYSPRTLRRAGRGPRRLPGSLLASAPAARVLRAADRRAAQGPWGPDGVI